MTVVTVFKKIYTFLLDSVQTFLIAAAIFLLIYVFLFRPFEVKGDSMYPNFYNHEYVLTNLVILHFQSPKRGDIVVFKAPPDPSKDYIKRIVGIPGDTILLKGTDIYLNGKLLDENAYLSSDIKTFAGTFLKDGESITVPTNEYFVMGDNRIYSSDSREWGFVKKDYLIGESMFVYWPLNKMRLITNPNKD